MPLRKKRSEKQNIIPNIETVSCLNCDLFDFYDYSDGTLDGTCRGRDAMLCVLFS